MQKTNRDKFNLRDQKKKLKKRQLAATLTLNQWEDIKNYFNNKCAYCGENTKLTQDHFTPISKGGEYTHNNIIPACGSCNSSKRNREFIEWYPKQKFYSKKREKAILKFLNYKGEVQQLAINI